MLVNLFERQDGTLFLWSPEHGYGHVVVRDDMQRRFLDDAREFEDLGEPTGDDVGQYDRLIASYDSNTDRMYLHADPRKPGWEYLTGAVWVPITQSRASRPDNFPTSYCKGSAPSEKQIVDSLRNGALEAKASRDSRGQGFRP